MPQRPFRFGIINEQSLERTVWLAQVQRAEALGYATFLIRDHLVDEPFGAQYAPITALAMAAAMTTTLRVGTMVIANDFRHPAFLAKEFATLAALSGGRAELGIGAGWMRAEYEQAGIEFDRASVRIDRLGEALEIISGLWRGEPYSFEGCHYRVDGLQSFPPLTDAQRPRILIGGGRPRMLRLAGRFADSIGVLTSAYGTGEMVPRVDERTPEAVREKIGWIREGAGSRFNQIELSMIPTIVVTDDRDTAATSVIEQYGWRGCSVSDVLAMPSMLIGTVEEISAGIVQRREEYGFSYIIASDTQMEELAPIVGALAGR
ncbi:MAG: TIGR03621 family F420-dependent LLM class oxidoreductase [Thermomicrobiales bacterium]|nr:TIGR03621 family F420-dependent LLM class oxidoreductase [Thermomicrobiales bacterium]